MGTKTLNDFQNMIVIKECSKPDRLNGTIEFNGVAKADLNTIESFSAFSNSFLVHSELLKQAAISHIKHIRTFSKVTDFDNGAINMLVVFFNLTLEDLK